MSEVCKIIIAPNIYWTLEIDQILYNIVYVCLKSFNPRTA